MFVLILQLPSSSLVGPKSFLSIFLSNTESQQHDTIFVILNCLLSWRGKIRILRPQLYLCLTVSVPIASFETVEKLYKTWCGKYTIKGNPRAVDLNKLKWEIFMTDKRNCEAGATISPFILRLLKWHVAINPGAKCRFGSDSIFVECKWQNGGHANIFFVFKFDCDKKNYHCS